MSGRSPWRGRQAGLRFWAGITVFVATVTPLVDTPPRIALMVAVLISLLAAPLVLRRSDGIEGVAVGAICGLVVGALALPLIPTPNDGPMTRDTVAAEDDSTTQPSFQSLWEEAMRQVDEVMPGGSDSLIRVQLDDTTGERRVSVYYIDERGVGHYLFQSSGEWNEPSTLSDAGWSRRDSFSADDVTANLDDVVARVVTSSAVVNPEYTFLSLNVEKADPEIVVDTRGAERVIGTDSEALLSVDLRADPDDIIGDEEFEALGDGSLPATVPPIESPGALALRGQTALQIAGADLNTARVTGLDIDSDSRGRNARLALRTPERWFNARWTSGTFTRVTSSPSTYIDDEPLYRDLDAEALDQMVEDARRRGNLDEAERDDVSLSIDLSSYDFPGVEVSISTDDDATGIYTLDGTWIADAN